MAALAKIEIRKLSHRFAIDSVNSNAAHLAASREEIDIIDSAFVTSHVDAGGGRANAGLSLSPNVKRGESDIFSVHVHVELLVF